MGTSSAIVCILESACSVIVVLPTRSSKCLDVSFVLFQVFKSIYYDVLLAAITNVSSVVSATSSACDSSEASLDSMSLGTLVDVSYTSRSVFAGASTTDSFNGVQCGDNDISSNASIDVSTVSTSFVSREDFLDSRWFFSFGGSEALSCALLPPFAFLSCREGRDTGLLYRWGGRHREHCTVRRTSESQLKLHAFYTSYIRCFSPRGVGHSCQ